MLGLRGVRLGMVVPGLFAMQARAIVEAAADHSSGRRPATGDHGPAGGAARSSSSCARDRAPSPTDPDERGLDLPIRIGTMIEVPRAALTAGRIAEAADFFSFGTNDLTQMTWGFSRDDVEAAFLPPYLTSGIFARLAVRVHRRRRRRPAGRDRGGARAARPAGPAPRRLRRARRRPGSIHFFDRPASTTSRARRSGSRSPGWRRLGRCSVADERHGIGWIG